MSSENDRLIQLHERIAINERDTNAAHKRIDALDKMLRDDIKQMKVEFKEDIKVISDDMKTVLAFLERGKGMIALMTIFAGVLGWIIQQIVGALFHK